MLRVKQILKQACQCK